MTDGAKMALLIKRLRPYLYVLGTLFSLAVLVDQWNANWSDIRALRWHLKHGFTARCCGMEIRVPLKYWRDDDAWGFYLSNMPGRWRQRYLHASLSMISLAPAHHAVSIYDEHQVEQAKQRLISFWEDKGCKHAADRTIEVAGRRLECSEFSCPSLAGSDHQNILGPSSQVVCSGDGLFASFFGGDKLRDDFYSIMKTAKPIAE